MAKPNTPSRYKQKLNRTAASYKTAAKAAATSPIQDVVTTIPPTAAPVTKAPGPAETDTDQLFESNLAKVIQYNRKRQRLLDALDAEPRITRRARMPKRTNLLIENTPDIRTDKLTNDALEIKVARTQVVREIDDVATATLIRAKSEQTFGRDGSNLRRAAVAKTTDGAIVPDVRTPETQGRNPKRKSSKVMLDEARGTREKQRQSILAGNPDGIAARTRRGRAPLVAAEVTG